jgi:hypothetical protein
MISTAFTPLALLFSRFHEIVEALGGSIIHSTSSSVACAVGTSPISPVHPVSVSLDYPVA